MGLLGCVLEIRHMVSARVYIGRMCNEGHALHTALRSSYMVLVGMQFALDVWYARGVSMILGPTGSSTKWSLTQLYRFIPGFLVVRFFTKDYVIRSLGLVMMGFTKPIAPRVRMGSREISDRLSLGRNICTFNTACN